MKTDVEALRKKYMNHPPEGLTSTDLHHMCEEDLLDMDYFLNDDDPDEEFGEESLYLFWFLNRLSVLPTYQQAFLIQRSAVGGLSYKVRNTHCRIPSELSLITTQHIHPKKHSDFWIRHQKIGLSLYSHQNMVPG